MRSLLPTIFVLAMPAPIAAQGAAPLAATQVGAMPIGRAATAVTTGHVRLATGIRMHYAAAGDPAAEPVILLHGYTDSWRSYELVLADLARTRRVYALDQRGHGETDRPDDGYLVRDLASDVVAFMDAMRIPRAAVVGHSMGSLVAQFVTQAAPTRVTRLVLVGSGTRAANITGVDDFKAAIDALTDPVPEAFAREFQRSSVNLPVPEAFMDGAVRTTLRMPARTWRRILDGMIASGPATELARHRVPTLLIWGDRDATFGRAEQDGLLGLIPGARLVVYEETGHSPHWERPERFAGDVEAFLDAGGRRS